MEHMIAELDDKLVNKGTEAGEKEDVCEHYFADAEKLRQETVKQKNLCKSDMDTVAAEIGEIKANIEVTRSDISTTEKARKERNTRVEGGVGTIEDGGSPF